MDRLIAARVFVSIVEQGSLSAAARTLDLSRAQVTRYLARMEQWADARLLHRSTRRLSLTAAGERALSGCREMLTLAEDIETLGGTDGGQPRGRLRVACTPSLAQAALGKALTGYLQAYRHTAIDLQVGYHPVNLVEERIDLAIRITNQLDPNLIARRLANCASVVCAAPSYLAAHGMPERVEALADHNCLTYSYFGKSLWRFHRHGRHGGEGDGGEVSVPVEGTLNANDPMALLEAASEGLGIALQPVYAAAPLIKSGRLVALLPDWRPEDLAISAIYRSRRHMPPALRVLLDHLAEWFGQDPLWH